MKKSELRQLIRESIIRIIAKRKKPLNEAFTSKKLGMMWKKMGDASSFFGGTANTMDIAWDQVPDKAVKKGKKGNPSNDVMNFFFVNKKKSNPYEGSYWYGDITPGLIGATIGKQKLMTGHGHYKSAKGPTQDYASGKQVTSIVKQKVASTRKYGDVGQNVENVHNYKRFDEVADEVWTVNLIGLPTNTEIKARRKDQKDGTLALKDLTSIARSNQSKYQQAITKMVGEGGKRLLVKMMDEAQDLVNKAGVATNSMYKKGFYQDSWKGGLENVTRNHSRMLEKFQYYVQSEATYIKQQKKEAAKSKSKLTKDDQYYASRYEKSSMDRYAKEMRDYFRTLEKAVDYVLNGEQIPLVRN